MIVGGIAHQHRVRVVEGRTLVQPQLHVGHEGAAGAAASGGAQMKGDVQCDAVVPLAGAGHRVYAAADEFVLDRRAFFQAQVFVLGHRLQRVSAGHGGWRELWNRAELCRARTAPGLHSSYLGLQSARCTMRPSRLAAPR